MSGRLAVAGMVAMAVLYPFLILSLATALCLLAWWLVRRPFGALYFWGTALFAVMTALALLFSLVVLLIRWQVSPPEGMYLNARHEPSIFELVSRIAKRLGVAPAERILITPGFEAAIGRFKFSDEIAQPHPEHVLILGVQDILASSSAELSATICHELAHAASGDTAGGRFAHRFVMAMGAALGIYDPDDPDRTYLAWIVHLPLVGYLKLFLTLYLLDSRKRELRADRAAAQICGPQVTRDMLRKVHRAQHIPEIGLGEILDTAAHADPPPRNVYDLFRMRLAAVTDKRWADVENLCFMEPRTPWTTHPNLADRYRGLAGIDAPELAPGRPACRLFRDWQRIEFSHSALLMALAAEHQKAVDRSLDRILRQF